MKRLAILLAAVLLSLGAAAKPVKEIREVKILAELLPNGDAWITQFWEVEAGDTGTEFYVPIGNLGPMSVSDLHVWDGETEFESLEGDWDVEKDRDWKTGKCGIVQKEDGVELCWGLGEPGDHEWTVVYYVSGLVQAYDDADAFNFMFVNRGMDPAPQCAIVLITRADDFECPKWTYDNTRVWAFGFRGEINVDEDGDILAATDDPMDRSMALIAMVRFEKGIFTPDVVREGPVQNLIAAALDGSSYGEEEEDDGDGGLVILIILCLLGSAIWGVYVATMTALGLKWKPSMFGRTKITEWFRESPLEKNLPAAYYALSKGRRFGVSETKESNLIGAFFLRWVMDGHVGVQPDPKSDKRVNLVFKSEKLEAATPVEESLYQMARMAAGTNLVLEKGEFERWSRQNASRVMGWPARARAEGLAFLMQKGFLVNGEKATLDGQKELSHVVEFKNFLKDFTLSDQRTATEVGLWKDYLVYAQLFGIAEQVAKQFKKLFPAEFDDLARQTGLTSSDMLLYTMIWTNSISSRAFSGATFKTGSASGLGGGASFLGGGGFSGGGFGGGGR